MSVPDGRWAGGGWAPAYHEIPHRRIPHGIPWWGGGGDGRDDLGSQDDGGLLKVDEVSHIWLEIERMIVRHV